MRAKGQQPVVPGFKESNMVSATLTVEKSFTNFISRSGLEPYSRVDRLATLLEDSPFNYEQQACLYIVRDIPDPSQQCFNQEVNTILEELLMVAQGRTMVLFTSRKQLQDASFYLRPRLSGSNLKLLVQYEDGEFGALMDEFVSGITEY
jgi:Rad3-related DNA helicase